MALSEDEQQLLARLESDLAREDPHLASVLRGTPHVVVNRRGALLGGFGLIVGLALLVAGMSTHWLVSIVGFLVMLAATVITVRAYSMESGEDVAGRVPAAQVRTVRRPQGATVPRGGATAARGSLSARGGAGPLGGATAARQRDFMAAMEEQWRRRQLEQRGGE